MSWLLSWVLFAVLAALVFYVFIVPPRESYDYQHGVKLKHGPVPSNVKVLPTARTFAPGEDIDLEDVFS